LISELPSATALRPIRLVARVTIATVAAALVVASTMNAMLGHTDVAILYALGAPLCLAGWGFARAGNDEAAIVLLSCVLLVVVTMTLYLSSLGVHDHAVIAYSGILLVTALTLSRRAFIAMACLTAVAGIGIFLLEIAGLTNSRLWRITGWPALVDFMLITGVIGGLGRFMNEALVGSLGDARRDMQLDPATGLPGRGRFIELSRQQLREAMAQGSVDALVLADLAGFRRVNHLVGHEAGDRILGEVARRLKEIDPGLLAGRVGDDEFGLLAVGLPDAGAARSLSDLVQATLCFDHAGVTIRVAVGLGCRPHNSGGVDALFMAADEALARAVARSTGTSAAAS
jgi:diguanylate cyclase (GGDEF)-like protein